MKNNKIERTKDGQIKISKSKGINPYSDGLLKATEQIMSHIDNRIKHFKSKANIADANTPKQISRGGRIRALNEVLEYLKNKRLEIIENEKEQS